jgi:multidrug efflux pump subunit AcrA (membrane-fusion protein)
MYAEASITLQNRPEVLTLPSQAIVQGEAKPYVLVVDPGNKVEKRLVTLGIVGSDRTEIMTGLSEGESVITSAQSNYQTGEVVRPRQSTVVYRSEGGQK